MFTPKILTTLAVIGLAAAQSKICDKDGQINSQADALAYSSCTTVDGTLTFGPQTDENISLDGPKTITGDLIIKDAGNLRTFASTTLAKIEGSFTLNNVTLLSTLTMAQLTEVGEISWTALPALSALTFTEDIKKASKVLITNTFLSTLNGINLNTVDVLDINNNNRLREFSTQVGNITQSLIIDANGKDLDVSFPNLIWAANMTFRNASSVSIPSLEKVNGSLGFYGNLFEELLAPNLTSIGSSLAFVANPKLGNVTLPLLTSIGGANLIANNSALTDISFPTLKTVGGAIDFSGNFSLPDLGDLEDVKGGFNLQSTATIDCSEFEKLSGNIIQGTFKCKSAEADPESGVGGASTTTGSSSSSTKTPNAAPAYGPNTAVAGLSVIGGLLSMLL